MRNRQTRMIAGCGSGISCEEKYSSEEEMLEAAKRNVLKSSLIGTLERLSEMLVTANYVFGWDIQEYDAVRGTTDFWVLDWDESDVRRVPVTATPSHHAEANGAQSINATATHWRLLSGSLAPI